jgi:predicted HicB family RNase H-like nuclease
MTTPPTHGGPRLGAGRPRKPSRLFGVRIPAELYAACADQAAAAGISLHRYVLNALEKSLAERRK